MLAKRTNAMTETRSIAYQGEPGANSHIACVENFPDFTPVPCATFEDAFAALQDGSADLGMIPIENSIAGRVADIHALLPASGLHIVGETFLPIHFQLLAVPGARIEDLRTVHSHVHALGQCRNIIRRHKLKPVVAERHRGLGARGGGMGRQEPRLARHRARRPHLRPQDAGQRRRGRDAQHHPLRRAVHAASTGRRPETGRSSRPSSSGCATCPAALYKALGGFATNGVNMTKLESYMVEGEFAATQFLADVDGHPEDPPLARALEELDVLLARGPHPRRLSRPSLPDRDAERMREAAVPQAGIVCSQPAFPIDGAAA